MNGLAYCEVLKYATEILGGDPSRAGKRMGGEKGVIRSQEKNENRWVQAENYPNGET